MFLLFLNKMQVCKFITSFSALVLPFFRVFDRIIAKTPTDQCHTLQVFRPFGFKKLRRDRRYRFPALASAKICLQNYSLHTDYNIIIYMLLCFNKKSRNCLRVFTSLRRKRRAEVEPSHRRQWGSNPTRRRRQPKGKADAMPVFHDLPRQSHSRLLSPALARLGRLLALCRQP